MTQPLEKIVSDLKERRVFVAAELAAIDRMLTAHGVDVQNTSPVQRKLVFERPKRSSAPANPTAKLRAAVRDALSILPSSFTTADVRDAIRAGDATALGDRAGDLSKMLAKDQKDLNIEVMEPGVGKRPAKYRKTVV